MILRFLGREGISGWFRKDKMRLCPVQDRAALFWPSYFEFAQISFFCIAPAMWSACRMASATMVSVGLQAALLVNWLPSETNRFLMSCVCPNWLTTPSFGFALMRLVP